MSTEVVNTLITEMDANTIHLEQKLADTERKVAQLQQRVESGNRVTTQSTQAAAGSYGQLASRVGAASQAIAGASAQAANMGRLTVESAKTMIAQASNMAFMFGTAGPIVGAIGIATLAVVTLFGRARREMEETARHFDEKLAGMRKSGNLIGAAELQRELFSGDRFAEQGKDESDAVFRLRRLGVQGAKRRLAEIDALLTQWAKEDMNAVGPAIREARQLALNKLYEEQRQLTQALPEYEARHKKATAAVDELTAAEGKRAENLQTIERNQNAQKEALKATDERARDLARLAESVGDAAWKRAAGMGTPAEVLRATQEEAAALEAEMRALAAAMTPTAVDNLRIALEELQKDMKQNGRSDELIAWVTRWKQSVINATELTEKLQADMDRWAADTAAGLDRNVERTFLNEREQQLRNQLLLLEDTEEHLEARKLIEAAINQIVARRTALLKDDGSQTQAAVSNVEALATAVQNAANFAYGLAQAFGEGNTELGRMLTAVAQLSGGIAAIAKPGWSKLSGVEKLGAIGGIVGGGIALGQMLFSEDPEEKARREVIKENTEAILQLTDRVGLLGEVNLSGRTATTAASAVDALLMEIVRRHGYGTIDAARRDTANKVNLDALTPEQRRALQDVARELGITIDGTIGSYFKLIEALKSSWTKFAEFESDFAGRMRQDDAWRKIFGAEDPATELHQLAAAAGNLSPAVRGLLEGLNLNDPADLETLRKRVQDLFNTMMSGDEQLSAADLGGLTGDELLQVLLGFIDGIEALTPAVKTAGEALAEALSSIDQELEIMDVTDPGAQLARRADAYRAIGGSLGELFAGLDLTNPADVAKLDERVRGLFEQLKSSPESVNLAGLSVGELIQALLALDAAADDVAAGVISAAQAFSDAVASLDTDLEVAGEKDPLKRALGVAGAAGSSFAGIGAALAGIDLSTADGRAKAIAALQALYGSDKGNADQTQAILEVLRALRAIPGEAPLEEGRGGARAAGDREAITNSAKALTEATGNRMADYLRSIDIRVQTIVDLMARLAGLASGPVLTPAIALGGPFSGGFDAAPRITIQTTVYVSADDVRDGREWGRELGDGIFDRFNEQMGRKFRRAQIINGNTDRPGVS